jgi:hypothetical protein
MKVSQLENPFPNQICKDIYIIFSSKPRRIFSKEDIIDKSPKYSKSAIMDSLLELLKLEYIIASPNRTCYALNDEKIIKVKKTVTLNFKTYETTDNT